MADDRRDLLQAFLAIGLREDAALEYAARTACSGVSLRTAVRGTMADAVRMKLRALDDLGDEDALAEVVRSLGFDPETCPHLFKVAPYTTGPVSLGQVIEHWCRGRLDEHARSTGVELDKLRGVVLTWRQ